MQLNKVAVRVAHKGVGDIEALVMGQRRFELHTSAFEGRHRLLHLTGHQRDDRALSRLRLSVCAKANEPVV